MLTKDAVDELLRRKEFVEVMYSKDLDMKGDSLKKLDLAFRSFQKDYRLNFLATKGLGFKAYNQDRAIAAPMPILVEELLFLFFWFTSIISASNTVEQSLKLVDHMAMEYMIYEDYASFASKIRLHVDAITS